MQTLVEPAVVVVVVVVVVVEVVVVVVVVVVGDMLGDGEWSRRVDKKS